MPITGTSVKEQVQVQLENGKNEKEIMKIYAFNLQTYKHFWYSTDTGCQTSRMIQLKLAHYLFIQTILL